MHLAIIMDGNGRWAKARMMPRTYGHKVGMEKVIETIEWADERGIDVLTLYAFSTENWKRPESEVSFLMNLLVTYVDKELKRLHEKNAIVRVLGDMSELPEIVQKKLRESIELTKNNTGLIVNFAINYSGRAEIVHAVNGIIEDAKAGKIDKVDYDTLSDYFYTRGEEDPDLILRTSGEMRLSNFLLLQAAYSELMFIDESWPEINREILDRCLDDFNKRNRRFGGL